jgi:protein TonB
MYVPLIAAQDSLKSVRDQYQNKILVVRNFYAGHSLHFASNGKLTGKQVSDDWTTDGFVQIDEINGSGQSMLIRATRLQIGWSSKSGFTVLNKRDREGNLDKKEKKHHELQIQADIDSLAPQPVEVLLSQIFLTGADSFATAVPPYWKLCIHDGLSGIGNLAQTCSFSRELLDVPSLGEQAANAPLSPVIERDRSPFPLPTSKVEKGVVPPHATYSPEPPFTDLARARRFQGMLILSVRIDEAGHTNDIQIARPLGCGLDAQAVRAVADWKFIPATKDNRPVSFLVAIEVDFHLY